MKIEKALINNHIRVSKVSLKLRKPTIYNFAVIYRWNLLFSQKVAYFLTVSIVFPVYKQNSTAEQIKNQNRYECKNFSVCYLCWNDHIFVII